MRSKFKWIVMLLVAFIVQFSVAQEKTINGIITDGGLPLPGVSIHIKGTTTGTKSDINGRYVIKAHPGEVLEYTFLGMQTVTRKVGQQSVEDVGMEILAHELDHVVVVAYGKQDKKSIVGSVATVGKDILEKQQLTNITTAIQGSVPGVNVISSGGQPGEGPTIRIRGVGSISASSDPLIVVDGAVYNGNLNSISQDQVESMSVLKDASSTALYGSRGSNGVILITTKKGSRNRPAKVNVMSSTGIANRAVDMYELVGSGDFMKYSWEANRNSRLMANPGMTPQQAGAEAAGALIGNLGYNPYNVPNPIDANGNLVDGASLLWDTDWEKAIYRDNAIRTEHGITFDGGSEKTTYFFSANYLSQEGAVKQSGFERITTRLNLDTQLKDWLQVGINTSLTTSNQNFPSQSGNSYSSANQWIYNVSSIYPLYRRDDNGGLIYDDLGNLIYDYGNATGQSLNGTRPLFNNENAAGALTNNFNKNRRNSATVNGYAKIDFTDYLSFKTTLSYEQYAVTNKAYTNNKYGAAANVNGRVAETRSSTTTVNYNNALHFEKEFGNHKIGADAIFEAYQMDFDYLSAQGTGFLPGSQSLNASTLPESVGGYLNQERMVSYLGRAAYSYSDKYFLETSFRRDGSTRFSADTRWGNFYSVGGSWIVSDENFLKDNAVISLLKLKSSYGELGNNNIYDRNGNSSYFPYLQSYLAGWSQLDNPGVVLGPVTDSNLTWEKTTSFNGGVDLGFFNDRIGVGVEYYNKNSLDLIYAKPLPPSTGNVDYITNVGSLRNYGLEVSIQSKNIAADDFYWSTGLNFSFDRNEITSLTQDYFVSGTKRWEVGRSLYDFYMQEWAGVDPEDGMGMWYKDIIDTNGNPTGERETTKDYNEASRYYSKSSLPDVIGGFTNFIRYKNFDLNFLFNFSFGGYIYDSQYANLMSGFSEAGRAASKDIEGRWQNPGDVTDIPKLLDSQNNNSSVSTRFLFKNDYVRLKALTLGYNFSDKTAELMHMSKLRIYLQADNLWTYQSHKGLDPEQSIAGTTNNRGYNLRTVTLGVKVEF